MDAGSSSVRRRNLTQSLSIHRRQLRQRRRACSIREDFYDVVKARLQPDGILQQWLPNGDKADQTAVAKSLRQSFAYIRVYQSIEGWGWHFWRASSLFPIERPRRWLRACLLRQ